MDTTALETPCPVFREWIEKSVHGQGASPDADHVAEDAFPPIPRAVRPAPAPVEQAPEPQPEPEHEAAIPEPIPFPVTAHHEARTTTRPRRRPRAVGASGGGGEPVPLENLTTLAPRFNEPQLLTHYKLPVYPPKRKRSLNPINQLARLLGAFR